MTQTGDMAWHSTVAPNRTSDFLHDIDEEEVIPYPEHCWISLACNDFIV